MKQLVNLGQPGPVLEPMMADLSKRVDQIRLFDLHCSTRGGSISFEYRSLVVRSVSPPEAPDKLASQIQAVLDAPVGKKPIYGKIGNTFGRERLDLSLAAPTEVTTADVVESNHCLYLFRLVKTVRKQRFRRLIHPTFSMDWRFSNSFGPFSIAGDQNDLEILHRLFSNGKNFSDSDMPDVASFVFDHQLFKELTTSDGPESGHGVAPFNIHVDIGAKNKRASRAGAFSNYIPIIIDPDVGHPGGNGP